MANRYTTRIKANRATIHAAQGLQPVVAILELARFEHANEFFHPGCEIGQRRSIGMLVIGDILHEDQRRRQRATAGVRRACVRCSITIMQFRLVQSCSDDNQVGIAPRPACRAPQPHGIEIGDGVLFRIVAAFMGQRQHGDGFFAGRRSH